MRIIKSIAIHKRSTSEPVPRAVLIDKAYNEIFAPDNLLDMENVNLKRLSSNWAFSHSRLVYDLDLIQSQLLLEREKNVHMQHQFHWQSRLLVDLQKSLARHERLISILGEIGLCDNIVANAHAQISNGKSSVDALILAIREAAAVPESEWSVILPAVTGPKTQTEYTAALNLSLNARKELRKFKKIAKFWKKAALQRVSSFSSLVTPSVSALSSVHEKLSSERQDAVNTLVARRVQEARRVPLPSESVAPVVSSAAPSRFVSGSLAGSRHHRTFAQEALTHVVAKSPKVNADYHSVKARKVDEASQITAGKRPSVT